tara:strand:- start:307 stop:636 length:330 start_codon:yes stop_codon:yes gene_type:complete
MAKRNHTLEGYGKRPEEFTWHYEMEKSQKNSMGAGTVTRYTSADGSVTGKFQFLVTDDAGATLTSYTVNNGTQITEDWVIPAGGIFGPFRYISQFEVSAGQVLAFTPGA